jgi:hypothetical protein
LILLDTNVVSELMRRIPAPKVVGWLDRQPRSEFWLPSVVVFEVCMGIELERDLARRRALGVAFERLVRGLNRQIVTFDEASARAAATLAAQRQMTGNPIETEDTQIAGIAIAHRASVCTRNIKHFLDAGVTLHDPWS